MQWNNTAWEIHKQDIMVFVCWTSLITVVGTVGNILILVKYPITGGSRSVGFLVKALAGIDLLNCVMIPFAILLELSLVHNLVLCKLIEYIRHVLISASVVQLALVALEKYLLICRPHTVVSRRKYSIAISVSMVVLAVLNIPNAMLAKISNERTEASIHYFDMNITTCYMDTTGAMLGLAMGVFSLVFYWGTVIVMMTAYALVLRALYGRHKTKLQRLKNRNIHSVKDTSVYPRHQSSNVQKRPNERNGVYENTAYADDDKCISVINTTTKLQISAAHQPRCDDPQSADQQTCVADVSRLGQRQVRAGR